MALAEPKWWYRARPNWQAVALAPFASLYGRISGARLARPPRYRPRLPVLCIGNFTAGGTGKTPTAISVAGIVREAGLQPIFLTRGYGGSLAGPLLVDPHAHGAQEVSDEPLLLAREAPTVVARDRAAGMKLIEARFADETVVIMDDGLQNPAVAKTLTLAVVDARRLVGNGLCLPAGPLRAPLARQLPLVDAIIFSGAGAQDALTLPRRFSPPDNRRPAFRGTVGPAAGCAWVKGARLLAYAGIANPARFYALLASLGAAEIAERTFKDHHHYTAAEAAALLAEAESSGLRLVTTEKDFVRLQGARDARQELRERSLTVPIAMTLDAGARDFIRDALQRVRSGARP